MRQVAHLADLAALVGEEIAVGDWVSVDQARIDAFAHATGDVQWIHVDPERAADGPFGATVAHGFLTLALLPQLFASALAIADVRMGLNYGLNRVRFPAPVPSGSLVRGTFHVDKLEQFDWGRQVTMTATVEREGGDKPVCVAEVVYRYYRL